MLPSFFSIKQRLVLVGGCMLLLVVWVAYDTTASAAFSSKPLLSRFVGGEKKTAVVNTLPKPSVQGQARYVQDYGDLLTPEDEETLKQTLAAADAAGVVQMAIVTVPATDRELAEWAPELMNQWGVGDAKTDNGLLLLANAERIRNRQTGNRIFVGTGSGLEGSLPDAVIGRVLDTEALPAFEAGDPSVGIKRTALAYIALLQGNQQALQAYQPVHSGTRQPGWLFVLIVLVILLRFWNGNRMGGLGYGGGFGGYGGGGFGGGFGGGGFGGGSSGGGGAGR